LNLETPVKTVLTYDEAPVPTPEIPTLLTEELASEPKNYNLSSALSNPDVFNSSLNKWKELGALRVEEIIKNSSVPIDYHLRVTENNAQTGFGQVDRDGKLQGIGRECQDFIYEGQFKDNLYHGWGRYINETGVYWGNWS
jgi:hypothetical protein